MYYNIVFTTKRSTAVYFILSVFDNEMLAFAKAHHEGHHKYYLNGKTHDISEIDHVVVYDTSKVTPNKPDAIESIFKKLASEKVLAHIDIVSAVFSELGSQVTNRFIKGAWGSRRPPPIVSYARAKPRNELSLFHPTITTVAGKLYEGKHYRQAILDTYIALVDAVRKKSGLEDDGTALMMKAFSANAPILQVSNDMDEQKGFMWLYAGAVMGIRNPKAHRLIDQTDEQRTLEWLSFASVLFRVLDECKVNATSSVQ